MLGVSVFQQPAERQEALSALCSGRAAPVFELHHINLVAIT